MKPALFLKISVYTALVMAFGSSPRMPAGKGPDTLETSSFAGFLQGPDSSGAAVFPQDPSSNIQRTRQVLASYEAQLPRSGDSRDIILTELARLYFILGESAEWREKADCFNKGQYYAELSSQEQPHHVAGYYWQALNLAGLAEVTGAARALQLVPVIVEQLETAAAIDEAFDQAGPHRVLGRIYCEAPSWPLSAGDISKSLRHLRAAVQIAPENSTNHLYLAETLAQLGKSEEAYRELQQVFKASVHALSPHGLTEDCEQALALMTQYKTPQSDAAPREKAWTATLPESGRDHR
jgi:tetratricopeptide (TPR) repeat protein